MPSKIRILSDHTINQIAAGEVIENPASVVKELVENSIDAGATDICIEIKGGGRQLIRISDNGCGMHPDDAVLCLERHATSKLRALDDIHTLTTMGFRGEAIPSIASISKFSLLTCPHPDEKSQQPTGTLVIIDGGKIVSCTAAARSPGTTVEVKTLFFNVPVRKKFLKSPNVDANEILKTVTLIALGNPSIKFLLTNEGKTAISTPSGSQQTFQEQLRERIECILGNDFLHNCVPIDKHAHGMSLQGFVGLPAYTRHNRTGQYLFINRRAVVSSIVAFAVKDGYGTAIDSGRFPVFVLHLSISGDSVDVNVHPQKREVRLRQEQLVRDLVISGVRDALSHQLQPPPVFAAPHVISPVFAKAFSIKESFANQDDSPPWEFKPKQAPPPIYVDQISAAPRTQKISVAEPVFAFQSTITAPKVIAAIPRYLIIDGSIDNLFIARGCRAAERGGLFLADQKHAQARIIFEKLSQQHSDHRIATQSLLIPHTIELPPHESENLRLALPHLNAMGIHIKEFGASTFIIDALPQIFDHSQVDQLIHAIIHEGHSLNFEEHAKRIALAASRAAGNNDRRLSLTEGQALLDQLIACQQPYHCPSGKPVFVHMASEDLAKLFQK